LGPNMRLVRQLISLVLCPISILLKGYGKMNY
jgi:hypothetical protein